MAVELLAILAGVDAKWTLDNLDLVAMRGNPVPEVHPRIDRRVAALGALIFAFDFGRRKVGLKHQLGQVEVDFVGVFVQLGCHGCLMDSIKKASGDVLRFFSLARERCDTYRLASAAVVLLLLLGPRLSPLASFLLPRASGRSRQQRIQRTVTRP